MIRMRIRFYGHVQGVGFRYRAYYLAGQYGCTGWVRNMNDDTVQMEIQGKPEAIDMVVNTLRNARYIWITDMDIEKIPALEHESAFDIVH